MGFLSVGGNAVAIPVDLAGYVVPAVVARLPGDHGPLPFVQILDGFDDDRLLNVVGALAPETHKGGDGGGEVFGLSKNRDAAGERLFEQWFGVIDRPADVLTIAHTLSDNPEDGAEVAGRVLLGERAQFINFVVGQGPADDFLKQPFRFCAGGCAPISLISLCSLCVVSVPY